jgi:transcription elongation factor GreA
LSVMETKKTQMTRSAYERLQEELQQLEGEGREKIIAEIATARAHGDLSENAEYHAAREQQGLQEARVRQIKQMLENAEIIEADDDATVKPGKIVTIRWAGDDESETYLLGLREEKGGDHDVLTPESPIGKSLVGKNAGDKVVASIPAGEREIEILEVRSS